MCVLLSNHAQDHVVTSGSQTQRKWFCSVSVFMCFRTIAAILFRISHASTLTELDSWWEEADLVTDFVGAFQHLRLLHLIRRPGRRVHLWFCYSYPHLGYFSPRGMKPTLIIPVAYSWMGNMHLSLIFIKPLSFRPCILLLSGCLSPV